MVLVYTGFELPFGLLILKNFFDAIPIDLEEAAKIDGCNSIQVLWHVLIPLSLPGLFVAFLLILVYTWNEFLFAVTLLSANHARTAMVGLYDFQTSFEVLVFLNFVRKKGVAYEDFKAFYICNSVHFCII